MRNLQTVKCGHLERKTFAKIAEVQPMPYLLEVQKDSYNAFIEEGIGEVFEDFSPITDMADRYELYFLDHNLNGKPKYTEKECRERDVTYAVPLEVNVSLHNKVTGEVINQNVFMGDLPKMTDSGSFIINGAERVVVSQLVRSPGVYNAFTQDKSGKKLYATTVMPNRGAWLELELDSQDVLWIHVDRTRKVLATTFLRALGFGTNESILEVFGNNKIINATLEKDTCETEAEGLFEVYRRLRPGDMPSEEAVKQHLKNILYDVKRYDLARVGRYKYNKRLCFASRLPGAISNLDIVNEDGEVLISAGEVFTKETAKAIQNAGITTVEVKNNDGTTHLVLSNGVADFTEITGAPYKPFGLIETVYYPTLKFSYEIANLCKTMAVEDIAELKRTQINDL